MTLPRPRSWRAGGTAIAPTYLAAYVWAWTGVLLAAGAVWLSPAIQSVAHTLVPLNWKTPPHPVDAATIHTAFSLWANNARQTLGPLLLAVAFSLQHQDGRWMLTADAGKWRRAGELIVGIAFLANVVPLAIQLGTWGTRAIPTLPQVPLEMLAVVCAPTTWYLATRGRLTFRQVGGIAVLMVACLVAAACLETWAVA